MSTIDKAREMADTRALESRWPGVSETDLKVTADALQHGGRWLECLTIDEERELLVAIEEAMRHHDRHARLHRVVRKMIEHAAECMLAEEEDRTWRD